MSRRPAPRLLLAALVAGALALFAGAVLAAGAPEETTPPPRIYRWIDSNGIAHYTTDPSRVPRALRPDIPESPPPAPKGEAKGEVAGPAGPGAPAPGEAPSTPAPASGRQATPDAWAGMNRGETPPPTRSLSSSPFSEGGGGNEAAARAAGAPKPPPVGAAAPSPAGAGPPRPQSPQPASAGAAASPASGKSAGSEASAGPGPPPESQAKLDDLDYRIAALEAGIKADEKQIAAHLSNPKGGGPLASGDDPKFRELALRLPERLKELRKLQDERAKLVQK